MSIIDKQALREEFQYMQEHYSDPADHARQVIYIAAEALLDELEEAEYQRENVIRINCGLFENLTAAEKRIVELEAREVVLPPRAPENLAACLDGCDKWVIATTFRDTWNACLAEVVRVNAAVISNDSAIEELVAAGIITKVGE